MKKLVLLLFSVIQTVAIGISAQEFTPFEYGGRKPVLNDNINREKLLNAGNLLKDKSLLSEEFISDLTPQQYAEIKELILNKNKVLIQTENELNEKKALLKTLETSDNPNMKSIDKLIEEIGNLIVTRMRTNAECTQKIRSLLTEEQRVEFDMKILNIQ